MAQRAKREVVKDGSITTADILGTLIAHHTRSHRGYEWACIEELRSGTGYGPGNESGLDLFLINCFPSSRLRRVVYEVKISRQDFRREISKPLKRKVALLYSNQFYFAAPEGLIRPEELPPEAGLVEIGKNTEQLEQWHNGIGWVRPPWRVRTRAEAPWRDTPPPSWALFASLARRLSQLENKEIIATVPTLSDRSKLLARSAGAEDGAEHQD